MSLVFEQGSFLLPSGQRRKQQYITVSQQASSYFNLLPVLNVQITERADMSISKSISGSFNYVVFQDMPVTVQITGIYTLGRNCSSNQPSRATIQDLYTKYKIGNAQNKTLTITVKGKSYRVMAISLVQQGANQLGQGFMAYTLTMIGSRVD